MRRGIMVRLILGLGVTLLSYWPSLADVGLCQEPVTQQDLDGDGRPDVTVLDFALSPQYRNRPDQERIEGPARAYVYDGGADMKPSLDWAEATDFENDTWVIDVRGDGTAELIIVFGTDVGRQSAYLYDDRDGDRQVAYRLVGKELQVIESQYWTVEISAQGAWRLPGGALNQNLVFRSDPSNDGEPDREVVIADSNRDGIPEYMLLRVLSGSPEVVATTDHLRVNTGQHRSEEYKDAVFWPLLVSAHRDESYNFFDHCAAVSVNWAEAKIDRGGILGYPIETGYLIDSLKRWEKNSVNLADFENPMAWYDLAEDRDGNAELMVRQEYFAPFEPRILYGSFAQPTNQIRYSWDMDNNRTWDYKVDLVGRYELDSVVEFEDLALKTVPYDQFPYWVTERPWDAAFFVAAEGGAGWSSEGIYDWAGNQGFVGGQRVYSPLRDVYMTGRMEEPPREYYRDITEGYRGEYAFTFGSQPYLYFGPVDRSLHLLGAEWGMWKVDGVEKIIYEDVNEDGFIDRWEHFVGDHLDRSLIFVPPYLVYSTDREVRMVRTETGLSLFETLPPRNHEEWLALADKLRTHGQDYAPGDFAAMLDQFDEAVLVISGAAVRDFRFAEAGFRFVLEPTSAFRFQTEGGLELPGIAARDRSYLVSYDGALSATPLTQPALRLDAGGVATEPAPPQELEIGQVIVPVYNGGLEDAGEVVVMATFEQPSAQETLTTTVALVPGEGSARAQFEWVPPSPGAWDVTFVLGPGSPVAQGSAPASAVLEVEPADRVAALDLVRLDSAPAARWALAGLFLAVLLSAMVTGLLLWRSLDPRSE